ncbi:hypothetical protein EVAR_12446_1 [Eumeta japonica]|uniref:Uncharacterized protein n=1 Tax=Eumeta variegata TaxID=151549 RepID=A0A4C1U024_EUMVA|nr:hypothetical protein EVAR_12446_1 [Eumeta japonica]
MVELGDGLKDLGLKFGPTRPRPAWRTTVQCVLGSILITVINDVTTTSRTINLTCFPKHDASNIIIGLFDFKARLTGTTESRSFNAVRQY